MKTIKSSHIFHWNYKALIENDKTLTLFGCVNNFLERDNMFIFWIFQCFLLTKWMFYFYGRAYCTCWTFWFCRFGSFWKCTNTDLLGTILHFSCHFRLPKTNNGMPFTFINNNKKKVNVTLGWRLIPNWKGVLLYSTSTWLKSVKNFSTPFYILGGFFFLLQLQYDKGANMVFLNTFSVTSFSILVWRKSFRYFFSIR